MEIERYSLTTLNGIFIWHISITRTRHQDISTSWLPIRNESLQPCIPVVFLNIAIPFFRWKCREKTKDRSCILGSTSGKTARDCQRNVFCLWSRLRLVLCGPTNASESCVPMYHGDTVTTQENGPFRVHIEMAFWMIAQKFAILQKPPPLDES